MADIILASVYAPSEDINGYDQNFLQEEWWRTHIAIPTEHNPIAFDDTTDPDPNGSSEKASFARFGDNIQFLSGISSTLGLASPVERTVEIEAGANLFFPVLNAIEIDPEPLPGNAENFFDAVFFGNNISEMSAFIDGVAIPGLFDESTGNALDPVNPESRYQESDLESAPYNVDVVPGDNFLGLDPSDSYSAFSAGVHVGVGNLSPEEHTIQFKAALPNFSFELDVTYNISYDLNEIVGTNRKDRIQGTEGWDEIFGLNGKDNIVGLEGNDALYGGNGKDTLIGTNPHNTINPGEGEIDILYGGRGRDTYVLGDDDNAYYVGEGLRDYAIIRGFKRDIIQLSDEFSYRLDNTLTLGGENGTGTAIFLEGTDDELIGFVEGVTNLSLTCNDFVFV